MFPAPNLYDTALSEIVSCARAFLSWTDQLVYFFTYVTHVHVGRVKNIRRHPLAVFPLRDQNRCRIGT